jgi:TetR/AcrR family transcriptional repressor of lmrAB and yxaGH operons
MAQRMSSRPSPTGPQTAAGGETARPARGDGARRAFVTATAELLRRQGYAASGLNEIVARSGAPRGSLYFHFPGGKEELAVAAIEASGDQLARAIGRVLASSDDLGTALGALVDALAAGLQASDYADGCPVATVALEAASTSERIRAAADGAFSSWLAALAERLRASGLDEVAAERRALLVLSAIEGALLLARARGELGPLTAVREELVALAS